MTTASAYLGGYDFWRNSSGSSVDAEKINNKIEAIKRHKSETPNIVSQLAIFAEELVNLTKECSSPGWNGCKAAPLKEKALSNALRFLHLTVGLVPLPEVGVLPSGNVCLDWESNDLNDYTLCFNESEAISYAGTKNGKSFGGEFDFINNIPNDVVSEILKVTR